MKAYRISIYLADNQWGNDVMENEARAYVNAFYAALESSHCPLAPIVVSVFEHGAWFLQYYFNPDTSRQDWDKHYPIIIGTANDAAKFSAEVETIRADLARAEWDYLPECRNQGGAV